MPIETPVASSVPSTPSAAPPRIHITPTGRDALKLYEKEIATYLRELPRLLEDGSPGNMPW